MAPYLWCCESKRGQGVHVLEQRHGTNFTRPHTLQLPLALVSSTFHCHSLCPDRGSLLTLNANLGRLLQVPCPVGQRAFLPRRAPRWAHMESWHLQWCRPCLPEVSHHSVSNGTWTFLTGPQKWHCHSAMHLLTSSGWAGKLRSDGRFRTQMLLLVYFKITCISVPSESNFGGCGGISHKFPNKGYVCQFQEHIQTTSSSCTWCLKDTWTWLR